MKDFLLRELEVNDSVVMIVPNYRNMVLGRIISISAKTVRVQYQNNYEKLAEVSRYPGDVVKVDGPDLTRYLLIKE